MKNFIHGYQLRFDLLTCIWHLYLNVSECEVMVQVDSVAASTILTLFFEGKPSIYETVGNHVYYKFPI